MPTLLKHHFAIVAAAILGMGAASAQPQLPPTSWEVSGEFNYLSLTTPGSVPWRYGWLDVSHTASMFVDMAGYYFPLPTYRGLQKTPGTVLPLVAQNTKMTPDFLSFGGSSNVRLPARGIVLHPGFQCERAVVRIVAPGPGQYRVSGQFYGIDQNGSQTQTSNKLVSNTPLHPNQTLHTGSIGLPSQGQSSFTSKTVMLPAGGTLDFEVGCGGPNNNIFYFGSTGLHAVIEKTQTPYCEVSVAPPNAVPPPNPCLID